MRTPFKGSRALAAGLTGVVAAALYAAAALALPTPLSQIGTQGSGAGQLAQPNGIAIDGSGDVFVADRSNQRVSVFTSSGTFLRAFGRDVIDNGPATGFEVCTPADTCKQGGFPFDGSAGELNNPGGIAVDPSGRVFVVDLHNRISEFTESGAFVRAVGLDVVPGPPTDVVEVCTTGCQAGTAGDGPGELDGPEDVDIDGAGRLFVGDASNARVSVFDTAGGAPPTFLHAFGRDVDSTGDTTFEVCTATCKTGLTNDLAGSLHFPIGVGLDASGALYVAENVGARVSVIDAAGTAPSFAGAFGFGVDTGAAAFEVCTTASDCQSGIAGDSLGQLTQPSDAAVAAGLISVVDRNNHRVSQFTAGGPAPLQAFGFDVDPAGGAGFEICTTGTGCQTGTSGGGFGELSSPNRALADCCGALWVSDGFGRVQRFGEPGTPPAPTPTPLTPPPPPSPEQPVSCAGSKATIVGTAGRDALRGTARRNVIAGLGGNDVIRGLAGNDLICGGAGKDTLIGGKGRDLCAGGKGRDTGKGCEKGKV
jgi:sugar lactone lactonase YvrE